MTVHRFGEVPMDNGQSRQRMRPWLEAKVQAGNIPGLSWIDQEKKIFKVPWKHGGKHDWSEGDSTIFKEWALHTGRYREGVDQADWPTWKTRFRCALNKLPDIQEMKEYNQLDGSEPFRAYKFLSKEELNQKKLGNNEYREVCTLTPTSNTQNPALPDIVPVEVKAAPQSQLPNFPSDLEDLELDPIKSDPNLLANTQLNHIITPANDIKEEPGDHGDVEMTELYAELSLTTRGPQQHLSPLQVPRRQEPQDHEMEILLRYCQQQVQIFHVRSPHGCRLFYDPERNDQMLLEPLKQELFGPDQFEQLEFPQCETTNPGQEEHTYKLLTALDRGMLLECHNGNIYATRKSRCVIFISTPAINNGEPFKLERNVKVQVYDSHGYFEPMLQRYLSGASKKPLSHFVIGFGQRIMSNNADHSGLLISAQVNHSRSQHRLNQVSCASPLSSSINISQSDDFDKLLKLVKDESNAQVMEISNGLSA
ncbi:interferon regulatory factor 1-like isoform X2 [Ostrea edulis]|uniref:interferon regulatory factor 1-like isoform X2 n=1 Tax=Ostrea edulis TaxID=37623 RepID=UPI0020945E49|nr:interferon regulatory factor 1-like isoform X2 [Ostrea edulis]XP_048752703.1 interferon regulatory factor 1-like isoform X2 [Ostrea edulis]XP_056008582.1 interferon regulatory factor 1-like isoform X2 [Ostrea edulis]XP_056008583.1 interferon regulatory factor 1-like isoform X2 [Ostrea edulis]XP_056008584.1 interferon regulatory factor 1-like isoform X2 [Ostrea edulis]XP_056008585.1 interferon regulatory factor 1-like isoform X2 [Ostrea edulis]